MKKVLSRKRFFVLAATFVAVVFGGCGEGDSDGEEQTDVAIPAVIDSSPERAETALTTTQQLLAEMVILLRLEEKGHAVASYVGQVSEGPVTPPEAERERVVDVPVPVDGKAVGRTDTGAVVWAEESERSDPGGKGLDPVETEKARPPVATGEAAARSINVAREGEDIAAVRSMIAASRADKEIVEIRGARPHARTVFAATKSRQGTVSLSLYVYERDEWTVTDSLTFVPSRGDVPYRFESLLTKDGGEIVISEQVEDGWNIAVARRRIFAIRRRRFVEILSTVEAARVTGLDLAVERTIETDLAVRPGSFPADLKVGVRAEFAISKEPPAEFSSAACYRGEYAGRKWFDASFALFFKYDRSAGKYVFSGSSGITGGNAGTVDRLIESYETLPLDFPSLFGEIASRGDDPARAKFVCLVEALDLVGQAEAVRRMMDALSASGGSVGQAAARLVGRFGFDRSGWNFLKDAEIAFGTDDPLAAFSRAYPDAVGKKAVDVAAICLRTPEAAGLLSLAGRAVPDPAGETVFDGARTVTVALAVGDDFRLFVALRKMGADGFVPLRFELFGKSGADNMAVTVADLFRGENALRPELAAPDKRVYRYKEMWREKVLPGSGDNLVLRVDSIDGRETRSGRVDRSLLLVFAKDTTDKPYMIVLPVENLDYRDYGEVTFIDIDADGVKEIVGQGMSGHGERQTVATTFAYKWRAGKFEQIFERSVRGWLGCFFSNRITDMNGDGVLEIASAACSVQIGDYELFARRHPDNNEIVFRPQIDVLTYEFDKNAGRYDVTGNAGFRRTGEGLFAEWIGHVKDLQFSESQVGEKLPWRKGAYTWDGE